MSTLNVEVKDAPSTPLNLCIGIIYAPRVPTPSFVAFQAVELRPNVYTIQAFDQAGVVTDVYSGDLMNAFIRLATHLRMD